MTGWDAARSGDLLFCAGQDELAKGMRAYTASKWTHVGVFLALADAPGMLFVGEVSPATGTRLVPVAQYDGVAGELWAATVDGYRDGDDRRHLLAWLLPRLGDPPDRQEALDVARYRCCGGDLERQTFRGAALIEDMFASIGLPLAPVPFMAPSTIAVSPLVRQWRQLR